MFSRGALNGEIVNEIPVNSGNFVEEPGAAGTMNLAGHSTYIRRTRLEASIAIPLHGNASPKRRGTMRAGGYLVSDGVAEFILRSSMAASGSMLSTGSAGFSLRGALASTTAIILSGSSRIVHRVLQPAPRRITVTPEHRAMFVQPDRRSS